MQTKPIRWTMAVLAVTLLLSVPSATAQEAAGGVVNINTATADQLTVLPRVGPALAQRIVEYRDANGRFKATEELILVRGIGESTYKQIEPFVTVKGETTLLDAVSPASSDDS